MYPSVFPPHWFAHTSHLLSLSLSPLIFPASIPLSSLHLLPWLHVFPRFVSIPPPPPLYPSFVSSPPFPQLSSALMFDAVHVVVGAVRELNRSQEIGVKPLSCTSPQIWQHGTSLMNYLRMVNA